MIIEIGLHTGVKNIDLYNLELSDQRAKSTRGFLISQRIASDRLERAIDMYNLD